MQQQLLDRILRSRWQGRESRHSADVLNRLEIDVSNVITFLTETLPGTVATLAMFVGAFSYLFLMDHELALLIVLLIPVFMAASKIYIGRMRKLSRSVRDGDSRVQTVMQEAIQNRMLIKTMEGNGMMIGRLEQDRKSTRLNSSHANISYAVFCLKKK